MSNPENQRQDLAVASGPGCPSAAVLVAFAAGNLADPDLATVADHLSRCDTCESAVRSLSDEDSLSRRLRAAVQHASPLEEPACLRMQEAAKAIRPARDESATAETEIDARSSESASLLERQVTVTAAWSGGLPAAIGRYRVRSLLGRGGFGSVFLAHDPDLDRLVAIKVPRFDGVPSDERIEWFLQEAKSAARLKHPGIIAIYEVGRQADGSCYIVMEYVDGESLSAKMAHGRLPREQIIDIVCQTAEAIAYAHKKGLVHRDLKPGNILLDADGRVKVADFGLAVHEDQQRSRAGELAGTLAYMSPEQVRRDVHRLDGRSDIWALGVILYELLTGRRPFAGNKSELVDEIQSRSPKPPRQIDDTILPQLEHVCLKCLAKDAEQRYTSAGDVAQLLVRSKHGPPRAAQRRSRLTIWTLAALAVAGSAAALWLPSQYGNSKGPYLVDLSAEPFESVDLLNRDPEQLFPRDEPDQHWERQFKPSRIWVESNTSVFLGLGTTRSHAYRLRVEVSKVAAAGYASLFFGFEELPPVNGLRRWRCQALSIQRNPGWKPYVVREVLKVSESWSGSLGLDRDYLGDVLVEDLALRNVPLEVEVKGGRVVMVRAGGRPYPQLNDPPEGALDYSTFGRFGVVNCLGSSTFHSATFEMLETKKVR